MTEYKADYLMNTLFSYVDDCRFEVFKAFFEKNPFMMYRKFDVHKHYNYHYKGITILHYICLFSNNIEFLKFILNHNVTIFIQVKYYLKIG
jgi:hypothetical protein